MTAAWNRQAGRALLRAGEYQTMDQQVRRLRPGKKASTDFDTMLMRSARAATVIAGLIFIVTALHFGRPILVPVSLAIVIGLMFGPLADRIERAGIPPVVSAFAVLVSFIAIIGGSLLAFGIPLADWLDTLPLIWAKMKLALIELRSWLQTFDTLQEQIRSITGGEATIAVDNGDTATELAFLAPSLLGQIAIFLGSMYFFIATRHGIRSAVLRLCLDRRMRLRSARVFRDAEAAVSQYLLSISVINLGLGVAVAAAMALIGVPSPILWGLLAAALNYIVYVGPAAMLIVLVGVGMATFPTGWAVLGPAAAYLAINFVESQFITPFVIGTRLTVNPFIVFLAIVFGLWLWGPAGGFLAVPFLLIGAVAIGHLFAPAALPVRRPKPAAL